MGPRPLYYLQSRVGKVEEEDVQLNTTSCQELAALHCKAAQQDDDRGWSIIGWWSSTGAVVHKERLGYGQGRGV